MARGMILNLLAAGWLVRCANRSPERLADFVAAGATASASAAEAAAEADVMIACVTDDDASDQVWFGPDGFCAKARPTAVGIETSTLSVPFIRTWEKRLRQHHLQPLSCPVTGSRLGAEAGSLFAFVGGAGDTVERAAPILSAFCAKVERFETCVAAMQFKLIYNAMGLGIGAIVAEGLRMAQDAGIPPSQILTVLQDVGWGSSAVRSKGYAMMAAAHDAVSFTIGLAEKDLLYGSMVAAELGANAPFLAVSRTAYRKAAECGFASSDISAVIEAFER